VSCSTTITGFNGASLVLSSVKAVPTGSGDFLTAAAFSNNSNPNNTTMMGSFQTAFHVASGDQATIVITAAANIIGNSLEGCFISGTTSP
jgi:hypothetical protein